jgi:hypothetical protein
LVYIHTVANAPVDNGVRNSNAGRLINVNATVEGPPDAALGDARVVSVRKRLVEMHCASLCVVLPALVHLWDHRPSADKMIILNVV